MTSNQGQEHLVLDDILQYIPKFQNQTFVIFISGAILQQGKLQEFARQIAILHSLDIKIIIVHGSRPQISALLAQEGLKYHKYRNLRITTPEILTLVQSASWKLSYEILQALSNSHVTGFSIAPIIGNFVKAKGMGIIDGQNFLYTGQVDKVHKKRLQILLEHNYTPLLQPLGMDSEGTLFNLRAVEIAAHTAQVMKAAKFILLIEEDYRYLGNTMGFLNIQELDKQIEDLQTLPHSNDTQELLLERLQSAHQAAQQGIERIHLVHAIGKDYLLREIFTKEGNGLLISGNQFSQIRRAQPQDTKIILELLEKNNQLGEFRERGQEELVSNIEDFFLFEIEGAVCGAVALHPLKYHQTAELAALVVDQNYRQLGIGKKLVSFLLQFTQRKGMQSIYAMTTRAQQFFLEQGFEKLATEQTPEELLDKWNSDRSSQIFRYTLNQSL